MLRLCRVVVCRRSLRGLRGDVCLCGLGWRSLSCDAPFWCEEMERLGGVEGKEWNIETSLRTLLAAGADRSPASVFWCLSRLHLFAVYLQHASRFAFSFSLQSEDTDLQVPAESHGHAGPTKYFKMFKGDLYFAFEGGCSPKSALITTLPSERRGQNLG